MQRSNAMPHLPPDKEGRARNNALELPPESAAIPGVLSDTPRKRPRQATTSQPSMLALQRAVYESEPDSVIYNGIHECEDTDTGRIAHAVLAQSGVPVRRSNNPFGRPTDADFERVIIRKVVGLDPSLSQAGWSILETHMHPLTAIIMAGKETVEEKPFRGRRHLKVLSFSKCWASGVLRRHRPTPISEQCKNTPHSTLTLPVSHFSGDS